MLIITETVSTHRTTSMDPAPILKKSVQSSMFLLFSIRIQIDYNKIVTQTVYTMWKSNDCNDQKSLTRLK